VAVGRASPAGEAIDFKGSPQVATDGSVGKGLFSARAPAPTVTMVGRPACSTLASASVRTVWSLCKASGQPARDTTLTGASAGQVADMSWRDNEASCLPAM
jgi:hypothetical protein